MDELEITKAIISKDTDFVKRIISNIEALHEGEKFQNAILKICKNSTTLDSDFILHPKIVESIEKHFASISAFSAHILAEKIFKIVKENPIQSFPVFILRLLIFNVQILSAKKLKEFVKTDLIALLCTLMREKSRKYFRANIANIICCVFYTLSFEMKYQEIPEAEVWMLWRKILEANREDVCPILQFANQVLDSLVTSSKNSLTSSFDIENLLLSSNDNKKSNQNQRDLMRNEDFILFDFLRSNQTVFIDFFDENKLILFFQFMIRVAARNDLIEEFLNNDFLGNPTILFGPNSTKAKDAISKAFELEKLEKPFQLEQATNPKLTKCNLNIEPEIGKNIGKFYRNLKRKKYEKCWKSAIKIFKIDKTEFKEFVMGIKKDETDQFVDFLASEDGISFLTLNAKRKAEILRALNMILDVRNVSVVNIRLIFLSLMGSDEGKFKTDSINLATHIIRLNRSDFTMMAELISIAFTLFELVSLNLPDKGIDLDLDELCAYARAELRFIASAIRYATNIVANQFHIVTQIVPDLFHLLKFLKLENQIEKSEQLEHLLSTVSNGIVKERKTLHKFVPFIVAGSLTGGRELIYPMYLLLSACDSNDLAFLPTNLLPLAKMNFSLLQKQFYKSNKIYG